MFSRDAMVRPESGIRVFIRMERAPGVLARVLGPFTVCGFSPYALVLRSGARQTAFVFAEFDGMDSDRGSFVVERLKQMPCVMGARLSNVSRASVTHL